MPVTRPRNEPIACGSKACKVLCLLYDMGPQNPLIEQDVHHALDKLGNKWWHDALLRLVRLGFAERFGKRGGYSYAITPAGQGYVLARNWQNVEHATAR